MDRFYGARTRIARRIQGEPLADPYAGVKACLREAIEENSSGEFRAALARIMAQPGQLLAPESDVPWWTVFVVQTCQALGGGRRRTADWPAAAVDLAVGAINVGDDLGDRQWNSCWSSLTRAPNAGVALGFLAQYCVARSGERLGPERAQRVGQLLAQGCATSCDGQDLDFLMEEQSSVTEELAYQAMWKKSAELVAMAFRVGAACATDDPEAIEAAGRFGAHLGIVGQLVNDVGGLDPNSSRRGTDILQRKKTLPVAYALKVAEDEHIPALLDWYSGEASSDPEDEQRVAQLIADLGAFHYALALAEVHREEALTALRSLEDVSGHQSVRKLRPLIGRIRLGRE